MGRGPGPGTVTRTRVHLPGRACSAWRSFGLQRLAPGALSACVQLKLPAPAFKFWPAEEPAAARHEANLANCARRSTFARPGPPSKFMAFLGAGRALSKFGRPGPRRAVPSESRSPDRDVADTEPRGSGGSSHLGQAASSLSVPIMMAAL